MEHNDLGQLVAKSATLATTNKPVEPNYAFHATVIGFAAVAIGILAYRGVKRFTDYRKHQHNLKPDYTPRDVSS